MTRSLQVRRSVGVKLAAVAAIIGGVAANAVAFAAASPLIATATTESDQAKTDILAMGGILFVCTLALWGTYKLIGMFGRR